MAGTAGRALDPPLRSRFNAALVPPVSPEELAEALAAGGVGRGPTADLLAVAATLQGLEAQALGPSNICLYLTEKCDFD